MREQAINQEPNDESLGGEPTGFNTPFLPHTHAIQTDLYGKSHPHVSIPWLAKIS